MKEMSQQQYVLGGMFALANRLQALGDKMDSHITVKQWLLMAVVEKSVQPPSLGDISDMIGTSRQSVKKMAKLLEKQGFISLEKDADDKRFLRVHLTEKCSVYFNQRRQIESLFMQELFLDFSNERLSGLFEGLKKLAENIEKMEKSYEEKK